MGNLIINSQFKPFSYDEMIKPVAMADAAHKDIEESQGQLETLASVWENKLSQEKDPVARQQYMGYINKLREKSDILYQKGLAPSTKQDLINLKKSYATDIVPIETAYKTRESRAEEQRQLQMKDPTMLLERNLGEASVDEFMKNPNLSAATYSGSLLSKQVADAVKPYSEKLLQTTSLRNKNPQYFEYIQRYGIDSKVIDAVKRGEIKGDFADQLNNIVNGVMQSSGISNWNNQTAYDRGLDYAHQGLSAAIGGDKAQLVQDNSLDMQLKRAQLNALTIPQEREALPSTVPHYNINTGVGKQIAKGEAKLTDQYGKPNKEIFGTNGKVNMFQRESDFRDLRTNPGKTGETLKKYKAQGAKGEGGAKAYLPHFAPKQNFDNDIYTLFKSAGVKDGDDFKTVQNKVALYKNKSQISATGFRSNLTDYSGVSSDIDTKLSTGMQFIYPIDPDTGKPDKSSPITMDKIQGMKTTATDPSIREIEYVPAYGGAVVTLPDGSLAKMDFVLDQQTTRFLEQGDAWVQQALEADDIETATRRAARVNAELVKRYSHGRNQVEGNTNKAAGSAISRGETF